MKSIFCLICALLAAACFSPAQAALNIFACEPEWAALSQELGGDLVSTYSATTAQQDPHQIQARPSLIARARQADLVICSGAELESGWLPQVLRQAANGKVQPGASGNLEAALLVPRLDIPQRLDRAEGDVHSSGNPHIQMDPRNIAKVADALVQKLVQLDAAHAAQYAERHERFAKRWSEALTQWTARGARLKGLRVVTHHKNMVYLLNWLGMVEAANLEPKPGIPPSVSHLQELLTTLKATPVRGILRMPYEDEGASQWLSGHSGVPALVLPGSVGGLPDSDNLFKLFDVTLTQLLKMAP